MPHNLLPNHAHGHAYSAVYKWAAFSVYLGILLYTFMLLFVQEKHAWLITANILWEKIQKKVAQYGNIIEQ